MFKKVVDKRERDYYNVVFINKNNKNSLEKVFKDRDVNYFKELEELKNDGWDKIKEFITHGWEIIKELNVCVNCKGVE
jgi:hypothetical protein